MKRAKRWICLLLFFFLCLITIWFLQNFTESKASVQYLEWQNAVKIEPDGTETPFTQEDYAQLPQKNDVFRFSLSLPPGNYDGNLLFETSGLDLTVELNGRTIWNSSVKTTDETFSLAQAVIPLSETASGELTMTCTVLEDTAGMFPPLLRFEPHASIDVSAYSYANLFGIPAGASAIVMLLVAGLFFLGILRQRIDWSLIPLFLAAMGLTLRRISQGLGTYFLPEPLASALSWNGIGIITLCMLALFLLMNRRRDFWRCFGLAAAGSAVVFAVSYLVSLSLNGYLSYYIRLQLDSLAQSGYYDGLLYWITMWMTIVCAGISAYVIMDSFAKQQIKTQTLSLKNQLVMDSYRAIETKMQDSAKLRHEMRHRITAMDALYQKGDYKALGSMLSEMLEQSSKIAQTFFTANFTVNAILQDAASRAAKSDISFQAQVHLPDKLPIPENDLCQLLMNMLDNALEAAEKVNPPQKRFLRFHAEEKNGFLAVKCENSFTGNLRRNAKEELLTLKEEKDIHGFGIKLMSDVARRYHSMLDISCSSDNVFTVQTALQLPKERHT